MRDRGERVALVYRGDRGSRTSTQIDPPRLVPVARALADVGFAPEPAVYDDAWADEITDQLLAVRAALVWVDPVAGTQDRTRLDALLRAVSASGVWVSAHPDVIEKIGTKEVLYRTRALGWGSDTALYAGPAELDVGLRARLAAGETRVLKQYRGNAGIGVWKVEPVAGSSDVLVQGAHRRDEVVERLPLTELLARLAQYFGYHDGHGRLIDQPFEPRIDEGLIRCYVVSDAVVGFARQHPAAGATRVFGLPSAKTMYDRDEPSLQRLRRLLESEWIPGLQQLLEITTASLPALWDADFLLGARDAGGDDTYVLAEINASCVTPFPEAAPAALAAAVARAVRPE